jgi:hypothetical protein
MRGYLAYLCVRYHLLLAKYPNVMLTVRNCGAGSWTSKTTRNAPVFFLSRPSGNSGRRRLPVTMESTPRSKRGSVLSWQKNGASQSTFHIPAKLTSLLFRAAKKLARRRYDPPKQPKPTPDVGLKAASAALASAPAAEKYHPQFIHIN